MDGVTIAQDDRLVAYRNRVEMINQKVLGPTKQLTMFRISS
jgi:hypothetical protein